MEKWDNIYIWYNNHVISIIYGYDMDVGSMDKWLIRIPKWQEWWTVCSFTITFVYLSRMFILRKANGFSIKSLRDQVRMDTNSSNYTIAITFTIHIHKITPFYKLKSLQSFGDCRVQSDQVKTKIIINLQDKRRQRDFQIVMLSLWRRSI